ncbi:MAG TPA: hypothetical protein VMU51_25060 [Mycobacteriales bacterium]|nr:hypothetical protein [Mycobacteriales bacterium]
MSEIEAAADQLLTAVRAYVATVTESPAAAAASVLGASDRVRAAGIALEDAVADGAGWHIQLFLADPDDANPDGETGAGLD